MKNLIVFAMALVFGYAAADEQVTGVFVSYGSELGSGVYAPADSVTACKNAGTAKYIVSNWGGSIALKSAWALCVGKNNKPLNMYRCYDNDCSFYRSYSDRGY